jgi:tetratricopeptide (TPR) repeat protein
MDGADDIDDSERPLVAIAKPVIALFIGDEERSKAAEAAADRHPDPWVRAAMHLLRAGRSENDGDVATMGAELAAAREKFEQVGDGWGLGMALFIESGRLMVEGELEAAKGVIAECYDALKGLNTETGGGMIDFRMADILLRLGDLDGARERAQAALARRNLGTDDTAFAQALVARIEWVDGNLDLARAELADARERLARKPPSLPEQGHGRALIDALAAIVEADLGDLDAADRSVASGFAAAKATSDMPIVASVGVGAAAVAAARGELDEAEELLGAAAAIRGADEFTNPVVARLHDEARAAAYARGRALSREAALARLEAAASRAAPVGP